MGDSNMLQHLDPAGSALPVDFDIKEEEIDLGEDVIILSDEDDTECFLCEECGFTASSQSILLRHRTHHNISDLKLFTCVECTFKANYKGDLNLHMSVTHSPEYKPIIISENNTKVERGVGSGKIDFEWLKCDHCKFKTMLKASLLQHCSLHHSKRYRCCNGRCPFSTEDKDDLIIHIKNEHAMKRCEQCEMVICQCNNKELPKKCRNCKMATCRCGVWATRSQQHLINEKCNCTVGKIFKCSQCNSYRATCKQKVLRHMRWKHRSEIKRFLRTNTMSLRKELRQLVRTEAWYKCGICSFQANSKDEVSVHFLNIHLKR